MEITRSEITRRDKSAKIVRESLSLRDRYICVSIVFSAERRLLEREKRKREEEEGTTSETGLFHMGRLSKRHSDT